jgi:hypothetical protein
LSPSRRPPSPPTFFTPAARDARHGGDNPIGQPAQGQRLQPHTPRTAQCREEQALAAEQRRFDLADVLNVVLDRGLKRHDATGVDANHFAGRKGPFLQGAASVDEYPAVTLQELHDEALAAKQTDAKLALKGDTEAHAFCGGEEGILLCDELAANLGEMDGNDLPDTERRTPPFFSGRSD